MTVERIQAKAYEIQYWNPSTGFFSDLVNRVAVELGLEYDFVYQVLKSS